MLSLSCVAAFCECGNIEVLILRDEDRKKEGKGDEKLLKLFL